MPTRKKAPPVKLVSTEARQPTLLELIQDNANALDTYKASVKNYTDGLENEMFALRARAKAAEDRIKKLERLIG